MPQRRYTTPERSGACSCGPCACGGGGEALVTILLGVSLGLSFIFLVVAGAVFHDFLPFINLVFVVILPIAVVIGDMFQAPKFLQYGAGEREAVGANFGACFFGAVLVSMFALPLVLLHTRQVTNEGFALWIASTVVSSASAIFFWFARRRAADAT
jgi:hypothetical protein